MAKVFKGKVVIPGEQLADYFKAMKMAEAARAPFRLYLEGLADEFAADLRSRYARNTVNKHHGTVIMFIEFLISYTDVESIQDITRGIANSHFRSWYKRKVWDSMTERDLKVGIRKFFHFLASKRIEFDLKILIGLS